MKPSNKNRPAAKAKERKDTMNKKLIVLLASTAVLATAITAAACEAESEEVCYTDGNGVILFS